jgi:HAD superfamily hydrolase (TIGR01509 family)
VLTNWVNQSVALPLIDAITQLLARPWNAVVNQPVKAIVFDFDGTIADSLQASLVIGNRLAEEFGLEPVTPEKLERWQQLSSKQVLKELNIPFFKLPRLLGHFKRALSQEIRHFPMISGMREVILELWDRHFLLGIVTSNSEENVRQFLTAQGIEHLFDFVESCPRLMGKDRILQRIARNHKLDLQHTLYVGDETRDIDAAKNCQMQAVAVTWGFNSRSALRAHKPDHLIESPRDLIAIAKQI